MQSPDWIVLRFSPQVPPEEVAPELEGHWFDRSTLGDRLAVTRPVPARPGLSTITRNSVARPTGTFEIDEDFNVGEVWEIETWH